MPKFIATEGIGGLYKGLTPLWGRQIPYTMMKFAAFENTVMVSRRRKRKKKRKKRNREKNDRRKKNRKLKKKTLSFKKKKKTTSGSLQGRRPQAQVRVLQAGAARRLVRRGLHRRRLLRRRLAPGGQPRLQAQRQQGGVGGRDRQGDGLGRADDARPAAAHHHDRHSHGPAVGHLRRIQGGGGAADDGVGGSSRKVEREKEKEFAFLVESLEKKFIRARENESEREREKETILLYFLFPVIQPPRFVIIFTSVQKEEETMREDAQKTKKL